MTRSVAEHERLLTICIPSYIPEHDVNRFEYLKTALLSILEQDNGRLEILICDQSPHDRTEKLVAQLNHPALRYLRNHSVGYGRNLDFGLRQAQCRYVMMYNDDDIMLEGAIQRVFEFLEQHPDISVVTRAFALFRVAGEGEVKVLVRRDAVRRDLVVETALDKVRMFWTGDACIGFQTGYIVEKAWIIKSGGYPHHGNFSQFNPILTTLLDFGRKGGYIDTPLVAAREHESCLGSAGNAYDITMEMLHAYNNIDRLKEQDPRCYKEVSDFMVHANLMLIPKNRINSGFYPTLRTLAKLVGHNPGYTLTSMRFYLAAALGLLPGPPRFYKALIHRLSEWNFKRRMRSENRRERDGTEEAIMQTIRRFEQERAKL